MAVNDADKTQASEIVNDFMRYQLNRRGHTWNNCPALPRPSKVCLVLRTLGDEFLTKYRDEFTQMCARLELTPSLAQAAFLGVLNELFSEGITWSRIVGAFAFSTELSSHCVEKNWADLVDSIASWLSSYVCTRLLPWIQDHQGWDGLIAYSEDREGRSTESPWPILKNVVCGVAVTALGALTLGAILTSKS
ncbi:bcl-2-like protein 1 [Ornithodoros turicata]|uniref:bcl-2-like protein 1 n=1 Tax=Ornithodoros turicata TaxID=34597 RepID=UPI0031394776